MNPFKGHCGSIAVLLWQIAGLPGSIKFSAFTWRAGDDRAACRTCFLAGSFQCRLTWEVCRPDDTRGKERNWTTDDQHAWRRNTPYRGGGRKGDSSIPSILFPEYRLYGLSTDLAS